MEAAKADEGQRNLQCWRSCCEGTWTDGSQALCVDVTPLHQRWILAIGLWRVRCSRMVGSAAPRPCLRLHAKRWITSWPGRLDSLLLCKSGPSPLFVW